jgi:hypothetical protein
MTFPYGINAVNLGAGTAYGPDAIGRVLGGGRMTQLPWHLYAGLDLHKILAKYAGKGDREWTTIEPRATGPSPTPSLGASSASDPTKLANYLNAFQWANAHNGATHANQFAPQSAAAAGGLGSDGLGIPSLISQPVVPLAAQSAVTGQALPAVAAAPASGSAFSAFGNAAPYGGVTVSAHTFY